MALHGIMSPQRSQEEIDEEERQRNGSQYTIPEKILGVAETGLSMATNAAGMMTGGYLGTLASAKDLDVGVRGSKKITDAMTYVPRSDAAKSFQRGLGTLMEKPNQILDSVKDTLGDTTLEETGSPGWATAAWMIPEVLSELPFLKIAKMASKNHTQYGVGSIDGAVVGPGRKQAGLFAGIHSKGANLGQLKTAKRMEEAGYSPEEIWEKAGWWNDGGDWKWEIDDSKSTIIDGSLGTEEVRGRLDHPELYSNDPESGVISVEYNENTGSPAARRGKIEGAIYMDENRMSFDSAFTPEDLKTPKLPSERFKTIPDDELKSVILHEIQHHLQKKEGWEQGGTPDSHFIKQYVGHYNSKTLPKLQAKYKQDLKAFKGSVSKNMGKLRKVLDDAAARKGRPLSLEEKIALREEMPGHIPLPEEPQKLTHHDAYAALKGEMEARLVQDRMNLTAKERRQIFPGTQLATSSRSEGTSYVGDGISQKNDLPTLEVKDYVPDPNKKPYVAPTLEEIKAWQEKKAKERANKP
jgi:hypothetical protein